MTRADRKAARRELAAWCRAVGVVPSGAAWTAASVDGVRDVPSLVRLNHADGHAAKRLPDGTMLAGAIRADDYLPDHDGTAAGPPVPDPDTGRLWVTVTHPDGTATDHDLDPLEPVHVVRRRTAPAWVLAAAAEYRDARDAWLAQRASGLPVDGRVPGAAGAAVAFYQLEDDDYRRLYPPPRYADHVREHAARMRQDA